jgi:DNA (cytosine-5)-methyltransferase 1
MAEAPFTYYEFFAGGGMARAGLGPAWRCLFANDFEPKKGQSYAANWGDDHLHIGDVWRVEPDQLPGQADLAWASSPCQDLSLAGKRAGLDGGRSSAFWGFFRLIEALNRESRAPRCIVIENVTGLLNSHGGADFTALCEALAREGYRFGALEVDACRFLPQSRPRLFMLATRDEVPAGLAGGPSLPFHGPKVGAAHQRLPEALKARWLWWRLGEPPRRNTVLADLLEPDGKVEWHTAEETARLVALLGPVHRRKLDAALAEGGRQVAGLYRRTRGGVQCAELRFDGLAGCLRTPGGGSSRQFLLVAEKGKVRTRLLTAREGARLMGLPDDYRLPDRDRAALHLVGDGVAVPVVRALAEGLIEPLLERSALLAAE